MVAAGVEVGHHRVTDVTGTAAPLFAAEAGRVPDIRVLGLECAPEVDVVQLGLGADAVVDVDLTIGVGVECCSRDRLQRRETGSPGERMSPTSGSPG